MELLRALSEGGRTQANSQVVARTSGLLLSTYHFPTRGFYHLNKGLSKAQAGLGKHFDDTLANALPGDASEG